MNAPAPMNALKPRREVRPYALDLQRAQRAKCRRGGWITVGWWLAAIALACAWDRAVWLIATDHGKVKLQWLEDSITWGNISNLLRNFVGGEPKDVDGNLFAALGYGATYVFGRIWPWIGLALVLIFRHWAGTDGAKVKRGLRCGVLVLLTPGLAGLAAEALKIVTRRMRPEANDGWWAFKAWPRGGVGEWLEVSGLGLASSHAAVAVGGALAAAAILPKEKGLVWTLAALCVIGRVAVGAHFVSDVVVGAAIGYATWRLVYAWDRRNNGGLGVDRTDLV